MKRTRHMKRKITRRVLHRLVFCNSRKMPVVVNDHGIRKEWVGIGWLSAGPADGSEEAIVV